MLARKVLDLAEQQGLLEPKAIEVLRQKVAETKFVVTPEAIAKILVDHGHLTPYQARKLVGQALGPLPDYPPPTRPAMRSNAPEEELTFSDPEDLAEYQRAQEEEIVELEAVDAPAPAPRKQVAPQPTAEQAPTRPIGRQAAKERRRNADRAAPPAVADEDLQSLEPVPSAPAPAGKWKSAKAKEAPAKATAATSDLLEESGGLLPQSSSAEALATEKSASPLLPAKRGKRNVWDSPLILVGGGVLGVLLIAFMALLYALTRGTAADAFAKTDEEYKRGNYGPAIDGYRRFLEQYPSDPTYAGVARVKLGLAQLHQVADGGKNPRLALDTAHQVLPEIEKEQKAFGDARPELASMLPDIADGFATLAGQAAETAKKEELVKLAGDAMQLVNNPSYLPATLRKEREGRIADILDKLKAAQRSIDQDKDLAAAIGKIKAAAEKGNAREAYQVRDALVRSYPGLEGNSQLVTAILGVGESERKLVQVVEGGPTATTDEPAAASARVILAPREGPAAAPAGKPVFVLVEGAVYGLDSASGRVLWRRFVGYETTISPVALTSGGANDALVVDSRTREVQRLSGTSGQVVWRQKLDDVPTAPQLAGERVIVTTRGGRIVALDAASGNTLQVAQLSQAAAVPAAVGGNPARLYQLGEHSTLFVLNGASLACTETVYLGHKAGEIFVPPAAVLDLVLVVESPADDYSLLRVLAPDEKSKRLVPKGRSIRLKGRVQTPLAVKGRRVALVTDLGQVVVYEVDAAAAEQPLRQVAAQQASESAPLLHYLAFDGNRLWTAGKRCVMLDVQASVQNFNRKWTANQDDLFLGPLAIQDETLVHIRRRPGGGAVLVEAVSAESGKSLWTTHLASPIVGMAVSEGRKAVDALSGEGRLFSLTGETLRAGVVEAPTFSPPPGSGQAILPEAAVAPDKSQLIWTEAQPGGRVYGYRVSAGGAPTSAGLPVGTEASAPAQLLGTRWLVPLSNGSVVLLEPGGAAPVVQPFMPPLEPSAPPLWTRPAISAGGDGFLISDGRGAIYSVALKGQQLAQAAATRTDGPIASPLVLAGSTYYGVLRRENSDALAGFDAQGQPAMEPIALTGRWKAGPFAAGGLVLLTAEPEGLLCYEAGGKLHWQQPLKHGPLAGAPVVCPGGDLLLRHQGGMVCRIDPASGAELSAHDVAEPLSGPAEILGQNVFLAGSDGVLHRIALPPRP
jgi:outer membrane protein assembly factor BamB